MDSKKFSAEAIREAETVLDRAEDFNSRTVLKGFTIDGYYSKDLDDGISFRIREDKYQLSVSIADVTSCISADSQLFADASERVETKYLQDFNIPMIPAILSEDRLSLLPGEPRPAITFDMELNEYGDVLNFGMRKTFFKNIRRMSYERFDDIEKNFPEDAHHELFRGMSRLAATLLEKRRQRGALAIYDIKRGIMTNEEGRIIGMPKDRAYNSHLIVQEFMILTNIAVAMFFAENDLPFLYRNHTTRQSVPDREDILEQISTALINPELLDSLITRGSLWFNKATYNPVIKGHFGLNLPAYTHVTSPLRRFADLVNHYMIKSFIDNSENLFDFSKLDSISGKINTKLSSIKDEISDQFKEKALNAAKLKLDFTGLDELKTMESGEFTKLINAAAVKDLLTDDLEIALIYRFNKSDINLNVVFIIFFKAPPKSEVWQVVRKRTLRYMLDNSGTGISLLNMMEQKGIIKNFEIISDGDINGFKSLIKVNFETGDYIETEPSFAKRKKDAINLAVCSLLNQMYKLEYKADKFNKLLIVENTNSAVDNQPDGNNSMNNAQNTEEETNMDTFGSEENYVGKLLELCSKNKSWGIPNFKFQLSGPEHAPMIICTGSIETPEHSIVETSEASTKKKAKQDAACRIIEKLIELYQFTRLDNAARPLLDNENYVGKLQELCVRNNYTQPLYDFSQTGTVNEPFFECTVRCGKSGEEHEFSASAKNKKSAKHSAAEQAYNYLSDKISV